jgi:hypothetical protein
VNFLGPFEHRGQKPVEIDQISQSKRSLKYSLLVMGNSGRETCVLRELKPTLSDGRTLTYGFN